MSRSDIPILPYCMTGFELSTSRWQIAMGLRFQATGVMQEFSTNPKRSLDRLLRSVYKILVGRQLKLKILNVIANSTLSVLKSKDKKNIKNHKEQRFLLQN